MYSASVKINAGFCISSNPFLKEVLVVHMKKIMEKERRTTDVGRKLSPTVFIHLFEI